MPTEVDSGGKKGKKKGRKKKRKTPGEIGDHCSAVARKRSWGKRKKNVQGPFEKKGPLGYLPPSVRRRDEKRGKKKGEGKRIAPILHAEEGKR